MKAFSFVMIVLLFGCGSTSTPSPFDSSINNLFKTVENSKTTLKLETIQCQHKETQRNTTCIVRAFLSDGTPFQLSLECPTVPDELCTVTAQAPTTSVQSNPRGGLSL
jgi:hypothetical protein